MNGTWIALSQLVVLVLVLVLTNSLTWIVHSLFRRVRDVEDRVEIHDKEIACWANSKPDGAEWTDEEWEELQAKLFGSSKQPPAKGEGDGQDAL